MEDVSLGVAKRIHREVRFGSYILGSTLGEGEFGKVKLGWRKDGKQPSQVAIKLIKRDTILKDSESEIKIHREINSLKLLKHPNIVSLVEVMKSGKYIGIVLEYASGGELFDYILKNKVLKENDAKKIFAQLVSGVDYMHSKGLIHRDLKLENLLLDKHKNVIISDFGFVNSYNKDKNDFMKTSCGSPCYAAPELVLTQSPYEGRKVDIWSLGVILYAMLSGYLPFDDDPENEDGSDIIKLYHYICRTPLTFPEYINPLPRDLLRKIIVPDPKRRININDIRRHSWLAPYANLLSVRQPEWDKIHKTKLVIPNTAKNYKRFSMVDERTISGYDNSSFFGLYSNPSTSSSLANAIAKSNVPTSTAEPSTKLPPLNYHSRSSSYTSASSALIAVVGNDFSTTSLNSLEQPIFGPPMTNNYSGTTISTIKEQEPSASRATSEAPSDSTSQAVTAESSIKHPEPLTSGNKDGRYNVRSSNEEQPKTNAPSSFSKSVGQPVERLPGSRDSNRLPHAHKKPRPTSYHPSSMSTSLGNQSTSTLLEFIKMPASNMPILLLLSSSPTKSSIESDSTNSSPQKNSRRDSVVTHVHVNGVLTSETSNLNSHTNKRNSVLSYLEDKIDTLELTDNHSPSKSATPQINQPPTFDAESPGASELNQQLPETVGSPTEPGIIKEEGQLDSTTNDISNSSTLKNDSTDVIDDQNDNLEKHQIQSVPVLIVESQKTPKELQITQQAPKHKTTKRKGPNSELPAPTAPLSKGRLRRPESRDVKESNKENKETKKKNRFSILSFYSNYNSSVTSVNSFSNTDHNTGTTAPVKKVLEPSTEINVASRPPSKEQSRVGSNGSSNSKKSINSGSVSSSEKGKEASAAKKVMDFFKRRSVRIT
ncbi:uncharacterized protein PRCAT00004195001 [Priceomyces carsonii]|uniref:uncharacterized protein n=1 Tax=Priceomyces carsonii TaxID=28549 RepID=UPI002EDAF098|nr:unnamed protein product [Priceomyces carsonii]